MKRPLLTLVFTLLMGLSAQASAACHGRIPNPVTDVCWQCLFPLTVGSNRLGTTGIAPDVGTTPG